MLTSHENLVLLNHVILFSSFSLLFDLNNTAASFKLCYSCEFHLGLDKSIRHFKKPGMVTRRDSIYPPEEG